MSASYSPPRHGFWLIRHAPLIKEHHGFPHPEAASLRLEPTALHPLALRLPPTALWVSSPWPRAYKTARALQQYTGRSYPYSLRCEEGLQEQNFGLWAGLSHQQAKADNPKAYAEFWQNPAGNSPPQGESFSGQVQRVGAALRHSLPWEDFPAKEETNKQEQDPSGHQIEETIWITHAGTIRAALAYALDGDLEAALRFQIDCLSLTRLEAIHQEKTAWQILTVNHTVNNNKTNNNKTIHQTAFPAHAPMLPSSAKRILILGGIRSGKSAYGESLALTITPEGEKPIYIATADPGLSARDPEMAARLETHRQRRDNRWHLIEEADTLAERITHLAQEKSHPPILIDSLTLWLATQIQKDKNIESEINHLGRALTQTPNPVILVSDEVGQGGISPHPATRLFTDCCGQLNTHMAHLCECVILVTAGLPHILKEPPPS